MPNSPGKRKAQLIKAHTFLLNEQKAGKEVQFKPTDISRLGLAYDPDEYVLEAEVWDYLHGLLPRLFKEREDFDDCVEDAVVDEQVIKLWGWRSKDAADKRAKKAWVLGLVSQAQ